MMKKRYYRPRNLKCSFCENGSEPNYKEAKVLRPFLTDRGKIVSRSRSGVCMKHQRQMSQAIKRARHMALLPYVSVLK